MNNPAKSSQTKSHQRKSTPSIDNATILLVDANSNADEHAGKLDEAFNRVITAESISTAKERLKTTHIDCIVSEYDLPEADGLVFLETVRSEHPDLPFVIWTAAGDETIASKAIASNVTD